MVNVVGTFSFSDEDILAVLEAARVAFKAGGKTELWWAIELCATQQAVMPEWMVDAIEAITKGLKSGKLDDWNDALGGKRVDPRTHRKQLQISTLKMEVTYAVYHESIKGRAVDDLLFQEIGERFGLPLRRVRECYNAGRKEFPKESWKKPGPNEIAAPLNVKVTIGRRTGRPIL